MYFILSFILYTKPLLYPHRSPIWANDPFCYYCHSFRHAILRRHQALAAQEVLNDMISLRLVVMKIQPMPRVRLDVRFEILSRDVGEVFLDGGWDGREFRIAGCEAVAAAVGEVICCAYIISMGELCKVWKGAGTTYSQ